MTIEELHQKLQRYIDIGDGDVEVRLGRWSPISCVRILLPLNEMGFLMLQSVDD